MQARWYMVTIRHRQTGEAADRLLRAYTLPEAIQTQEIENRRSLMFKEGKRYTTHTVDAVRPAYEREIADFVLRCSSEPMLVAEICAQMGWVSVSGSLGSPVIVRRDLSA